MSVLREGKSIQPKLILVRIGTSLYLNYNVMIYLTLSHMQNF